MHTPTAQDQDSVQPVLHCGKPVEPDYFADVWSRYSTYEEMPKWIEPYAIKHLEDWPWYCCACLVKKRWCDFRRDQYCWPSKLCIECEARISAVVPGKSGSRYKTIRTKRTKRALQSIKNPSDVEVFVAVALQETGGINGLAKAIANILKTPDVTHHAAAWRVRLLAALLRAMEKSVELELEARKAELTTVRLKDKSIKKFSDQDLRDALGPMLLDLLKRRPDVGIKALKASGYIVAKNALELDRAIRAKGQKFKEDMLVRLLKEENETA